MEAWKVNRGGSPRSGRSPEGASARSSRRVFSFRDGWVSKGPGAARSPQSQIRSERGPPRSDSGGAELREAVDFVGVEWTGSMNSKSVPSRTWSSASVLSQCSTSVVPLWCQCSTSVYQFNSVAGRYQYIISTEPVAVAGWLRLPCSPRTRSVQHQCSTRAALVQSSCITCATSAPPEHDQRSTSAVPSAYQETTWAIPVQHQCGTSGLPVRRHDQYDSTASVQYKCSTHAVPR